MVRNRSRFPRAAWVLGVTVLVGCGQNPRPSDEPAPSTEPTPKLVTYRGIDVSHYQSPINWNAVRASGVHFAFAKATQGTADVDPRFAENWAAMKAAGVLRGAYHFFDPDDDAESQARHFLATVPLVSGDLPPALDIEIREGRSEAAIETGIRLWLETVSKASGVTPIIYSDLSFIGSDIGDRFASYPLWIAFPSGSPPQKIGGWKKWTFWQYSQDGQVDGVAGSVDLDRFEGTEAMWNALLMP